MDNLIKPYISPNGTRLSEFAMKFLDDEIKPAYLLVDVEKLLGREFTTHNLMDQGLARGINFLVENASDLPTGVQDLNVLGAANGKRTVVSLDGLIRLIMAERNEYGEKVRKWLSEIVVPKALRAYPTISDHPTLGSLRRDVNDMANSIRVQAPELGLVEAISQTAAASFVKDHKVAIAFGVGVIVTATVAYIIHRRRKNKNSQ